jgi:glyoxylase-like metal-dependent hydrolase (beta-lactamase superfamily II)
VADLVRAVHQGRVVFHAGDEDLAPGVSVHLIGGHTDGLQVVRVHTARGWLVLASDASHYYENMEAGRPFPIVFDVGAMLEGFETLRRLASSDDAIVPGHDPLVLARYPPAAPGLDGVAVRLDEGRLPVAP